MNKLGIATYRGYLPDGYLISGSTGIFEDGVAPIYQAFATTKKSSAGYVGGTVRFEASDSLPVLSGVLQVDFGSERRLEVRSSPIP